MSKKTKIAVVLAMAILAMLCLFGCDGQLPLIGHTHTLAKHEAAAATCTQEGNIEYWQCAECGKYFSDAEGTTEIEQSAIILSKTAHTEETIPAVEADCTQTGLTEGKRCSVCGEILVEQQKTSLADHIDANSDCICDVCGTRSHTKRLANNQKSNLHRSRKSTQALHGLRNRTRSKNY